MKNNCVSLKQHNPNSYNALDAGICMIVCLGVFFALQEIIKVIVAPMLNDLENFDYYFFSFISLILSQGSLIIIALVFSKIRKVGLFSGGGFVCKFNLLQSLFAVVLTLGVFLLFSSLHNQFVDDVYYTLYGLSYNDFQALMPAYSGTEELALIIAFVLTPILPAICEEVVFRGIILRGSRQFGLVFSIIFSGALFMLMHGNLEQVVLQLLGGLAICAIVSITKNFFIGMVMHFANNAFAVIYVFIEMILTPAYDAVLILTGIIFIIIGATYFIKLAFSNQQKELLGKKDKLNVKTVEYSQIAASSDGCVKLSNFKTILVQNVDFSNYQKDKVNYFFIKNGKIMKMNKYSNKIASIIVLGASFLIAILMIVLAYV